MERGGWALAAVAALATALAAFPSAGRELDGSEAPPAGAAASEAEPAVQQVLVLQSFDRGILVLDHFTGVFRLGLEQRVGQSVNVVQVVVGPTGFVGAPEQAVVDYIQAMFADRPPPDLIVTVAGPAAAFARRHRGQLFPGTPLLFASVDQRWLRDAPLGENETAVAVVNDFPRMVDDILRVLPETRRVFMINGSGNLGRFWRRELEGEFARFRGRVTFEWSDELSLREIMHRCASLPSRSAIFYLTFGTDAQGGAFADEQVLADLHARANAPLFGALSPLLGHGIVGGTMVPIDDLGHSAADVASRILEGAPPESLRVPPRSPGQPTFDWRELERWDIPESRLPPDSVVRYRGPSLWSEHRAAVLVAVGALALQSLLIAWLLYEQRARRRAEIASGRNLALAAAADRRETISALTASIGHELGQPLTALLHNAQALQRLVAAGQLAPGELEEILGDIQSDAVLAQQIFDRHRTMLRSRELDKKQVDVNAVVRECLALLAHTMRARQIEVTLDLSPTPCVVDGDRVLLVQVLVNLARNAMDALAGTPQGRRRITIRSAVEAADVEISVSDTGSGLPAAILGTLFTPFVTTKPDGLGIGLTIARSIVDAHGGTLGARENPDRGATFTVTLPRSATPQLLSLATAVAEG